MCGDFVGESRAVDNVLVMPSGAMAGGYAISLGQIDWGALYAEREGYLFFEDLKVQWREAFSPDYVLVDSRTGFTDTSGICTRQLPDAVTVFFFPNEQNLRGLGQGGGRCPVGGGAAARKVDRIALCHVERARS